MFEPLGWLHQSRPCSSRRGNFWEILPPLFWSCDPSATANYSQLPTPQPQKLGGDQGGPSQYSMESLPQDLSGADMEEEEGSCFQRHAAERMFPGAAGGRPHHTWTERVWQENKSNPEQDGLPKWLSGKESACQAGDTCSISGSRRLPGGGSGNPLQYSCLGNPRDRGAWGLQSTGSQGSQTQLSD